MLLPNKAKSIAAVTLLSLGALGSQMLFRPEPAQAEGFHDNCTSARYDGSGGYGRLEAFCLTPNGSMNVTTLRLTNLIANLDGILYWVQNGRFDKTCYNMLIHTTANAVHLYADCHKDDETGTIVRDYIRLDTRIRYINGKLRYVYNPSYDEAPPAYSPPARDQL